MKAVIFAGGAGTRLWPLSRKKSPKQFEKILGDKSTLQLTVERLLSELAPEDIFISTSEAYVDIVYQQLSQVPQANVIGEPEKKDVGPAVGFIMNYLVKLGFQNEPVIILWSDHIVHKQKKFMQVIRAAEEVVSEDTGKIVFIGQKARYAADNFGWIEYGKVVKNTNSIKLREFAGLKYKPNPTLAEQYYTGNSHCWNLGYFITTPKLVVKLFELYAPTVNKISKIILSDFGSKNFKNTFRKEYHDMPVINFDNAILEKLDKNMALVIVEDIGWSDIGTWEALKEALGQRREDNITKGKISLEDCIDNLVYNYESGKVIVGVDLENLLVVNTKDVLLIAPKTSTSKIKKIVEGFEGTENERLT